jgi:hypothetical protein
MAAAAQALHPQTRRPKACTGQGFALYKFRSEVAAVVGLLGRDPSSAAATGDRREVKLEIEVSPRLTQVDRLG